ncbi:MAG: hypothetical protein ACM3QV_00140 [Caulobacteraceae bacterium]
MIKEKFKPKTKKASTYEPVAHDMPRSLPTGTYLVNNLNYDTNWFAGELKIVNTLQYDAVVTLTSITDTRTPLLSIYVRSGDGCHITGIDSGLIYSMYYMSGYDWDETLMRFSHTKSYKVFTNWFLFLDTDYKVTMQPVTGDNEYSRSVKESEFPMLMARLYTQYTV